MPIKNVTNEHEQLISILNQLMDEREILSRENEYLKAKLNESVLIETINEMKQERDLLFKLLSNVTTKYSNDKQSRYIRQHLKENNTEPLPTTLSYSIINGKTVNCNNSSAKQNSTVSCRNRSLTTNHGHIHRLKTNIEQQPTVNYRVENNKENLINNFDSPSSPSTTHLKSSQTNKKLFVPKTQEFNKLIRKHNVQLKHSQNSPFQHYRSQSLQDLT